MRVIYQSSRYAAERVTARYVRGHSDGLFRVYECEAQRGPTMREYDTAGIEIPKAIRDAAVGSTQLWV